MCLKIINKTLESKIYSEILKDARLKANFVKNDKAASGAERLLVDSLCTLIKALNYIELRAIHHVLGD